MGCFRHTRWTHPQILNFPLHAVMHTIFTKSLSSNRLQYLRPHNVTDKCHYRQIRQFFLIVLCQTHILLFLLTRSRTNMNKEYILPVILKSGSVRTLQSNCPSRPEAPASARLQMQVPQHQRHAWQYMPHFRWNTDFIMQSSSHIFLKMSTTKKCSFPTFHCFRQRSILVSADN